MLIPCFNGSISNVVVPYDKENIIKKSLLLDPNFFSWYTDIFLVNVIFLWSILPAYFKIMKQTDTKSGS